MGKYTLESLPQLEERIDRDLKHIMTAVQSLPESQAFLGAVLLGGYGRGEGTPFNSEPFNDYDLVILGRPMSRWHRQKLQKQLHQLEATLTAQLGIAVDLYLHTPDSLRNAGPTLMNVEMKRGHRVVWGDPALLADFPYNSLSEVPLEEGTRLLLNRGRLLLEVDSSELRLRKFIFKIYLAFGDCVLLALKQYDLYYANKAHRIVSACQSINIPQKEWLIAAYQRAIEFKLRGDASLLFEGNLQELYEEAKRTYLTFFLWYEGLRLGQPINSLDEYQEALAQHPEKGKQLLKAFALNGWLFGTWALRPKPVWMCLHPRKRLFVALLVLLKEEQPKADEELQRLLGCHLQGDLLLKRFKTLALRLE